MTLWPFDSLRRLRPLSDKGVSRSKRKAIVNPELAHAHPNRPQKAIGKRSPSFQSKPAKPPLYLTTAHPDHILARS
ncbi:hypothetical protein KY290_008880 [Solanum tuberosum]|uniref:Uncharacterized protein n=4 Tax=Solanum TaxID=4107 RepID=A0ABQ7TZ10_SOLTU|nr:hypothetical protein KY284_037396 [Solanum tuberosum]KAH0634620.1 hypothetical protein KY284_037406 [Solanum tuberosum]KAH0637710.1 hypothetical protein KY289_037625 [Solanum tuberosum]KAH0643481.1 hypothetical protein KY289_034455 [Solanum tuberosum]KAH0646294.1 hypothetical protein KY284_034178 [Solanum tuberosum]